MIFTLALPTFPSVRVLELMPKCRSRLYMMKYPSRRLRAHSIFSCRKSHSIHGGKSSQSAHSVRQRSALYLSPEASSTRLSRSRLVHYLLRFRSYLSEMSYTQMYSSEFVFAWASDYVFFFLVTHADSIAATLPWFRITIATLLSFLAAVLAGTYHFCYSAVASASVVLILPVSFFPSPSFLTQHIHILTLTPVPFLHLNRASSSSMALSNLCLATLSRVPCVFVMPSCTRSSSGSGSP